MNWGSGYKSGYLAAIKKSNPTWSNEKCLKWLDENIYKNSLGNGPSFFAVANKCCGGVDAHDENCR